MHLKSLDYRVYELSSQTLYTLYEGWAGPMREEIVYFPSFVCYCNGGSPNISASSAERPPHLLCIDSERQNSPVRHFDSPPEKLDG